MPEIAKQQLDYTDIDLPDLIDERYAMVQRKKEISAEERELNKQIAAIDEVLVAYHKDHPEVDRLTGNTSRITFSEEEVAIFDPDEPGYTKDEFLDWAKNNDALYLLTWSVNNARAREYRNLHGSLPHTKVWVKQKVHNNKR